MSDIDRQQRVVIFLPPEAIAKAKNIAKKDGQALSAYIRALVLRKLREEDENANK